MNKQFIQNTSDLANWIGNQYPEIKGTKATAIVRTLFGCITKSLYEQQVAGVDNPHVQLHGFGNIKLVKMAARQARNPRTGDKVQVGERVKLKWSASNNLKDAFNNKDEEFFNQFTTLSVDSSNGAGSHLGTDLSQTEMFADGRNVRNTTSQGAGQTPNIREVATVGGASEKKRTRRARSTPLSEGQPARKPRGRPRTRPTTESADASMGGAGTTTPRKRGRPARTAKTGTTSQTQVNDVVELRKAFDRFLSGLSV